MPANTRKRTLRQSLNQLGWGQAPTERRSQPGRDAPGELPPYAERARRGGGAPSPSRCRARHDEPESARGLCPAPAGAPGASASAWSCSCGAAPGRYGGDRGRPVAGMLCAAAALVRRARVRRTRAKLPPRNGGPGRPRPLMAGHPGRSTHSPVLAPARGAGPGRRRGTRRRCALEAFRERRNRLSVVAWWPGSTFAAAP
jgi:hypothetical protein